MCLCVWGLDGFGEAVQVMGGMFACSACNVHREQATRVKTLHCNVGHAVIV